MNANASTIKIALKKKEKKTTKTRLFLNKRTERSEQNKSSAFVISSGFSKTGKPHFNSQKLLSKRLCGFPQLISPLSLFPFLFLLRDFIR